MKEGHKFLINNLFVYSSRIFSKIITFFLFVYLARKLSVQDFGNLTLLTTITSILVFLQDLGTSNVIVRAVSRRKETFFNYFINVILLKSFIAVPIILAFLILYKVNIYSYFNLFVFAFLSVGIIAESFLMSGVKTLEGLERFQISSGLVLLERVLIISFLLFFSSFFVGIVSYSLSYLLSNAIIFFVVLLILNKKINDDNDNVSTYRIRSIVKESFIFYLFGIFSIIYNRIDVFILNFFHSSELVGIYKVMYQTIEALFFIPLSFSISLLPFLSRIYKQDLNFFKELVNLVFIFMLCVGLAMSLFLYQNFMEIISFIYGSKYTVFDRKLGVIVFLIPLFYMSNVMGNILIATFNEKYQLMAIIIGTIFKLIILGLFTQNYGLVSVITALLIGEFLCVIIQFYGARNFLKISFKNFGQGITLFVLLFILQILTKEILLSLLLLTLSILIITFYSYKYYRKFI